MTDHHAVLFENPVYVEQRQGALGAIHAYVPAGSQTLVVTTGGGIRRGWVEAINRGLPGSVTVHSSVTPNPDLDSLDASITRLRDADIGAIVAVGGGSVIDTAKAIRFGLATALTLDAILRRNASAPARGSIPLIAVPTTAGSGSEVTPFATIWDGRESRKRSLSGRYCFPTVALLDSVLTISLDEPGTLYPALDAISHALESLWNRNRTPVSRAFASEALRLLTASLPIVLGEPDNMEHRARMQEGSVLAGLAISQTRTALAHSISYPLTLRYGVPHGLACSFTLNALIEVHRPLLEQEVGATLVNQIASTIKMMSLAERMTTYATSDQVIALRDQMLNERAGNYVGTTTPEEVERIVTRSLGGDLAG